jgi:integrase/recombinase XerD
MEAKQTTQRTFHNQVDDYPDQWLEQFLLSKKIQGLSPGTVGFYRVKLAIFAGYLEGHQVTHISQITPNMIRSLLQWLEQTGHNPGGIHAVYR